MTTAHDLTYPNGATIRAGEVVVIRERFTISGGEQRLRIEWRGVLWQCREEDVRCS